MTGNTDDSTALVGAGSLSPRHFEELIEGSGLSAAVISERGYQSTAPAHALAVGFADWQCQWQQALLVPLYGTDGSNGRYALKPDQPRIRHGKRQKYDWPYGAPSMLDVPPRCLPTLVDAGVPLFITEGAKKADWLADHGYCALDTWGVHNWGKQTDPERHSYQGIELLADWQPILGGLAGRLVYLVFDSDAGSKPQVRQALRRLANKLTEWDAQVHIVRLPNEPDGSKNGVDDFGVRYGADAFADVVLRAEPHVKDPTRRLRQWGNLRRVADPILSADAKVVADALANEPHGPSGEVDVYWAGLCQQTGVTRATLGRCLKWLVDVGAIERRPNKRQLPSGEWRNSGTHITFVGGSASAFLDYLATLTIERPHHGGKRPGAGRKQNQVETSVDEFRNAFSNQVETSVGCPEHPGAPLACTCCGLVLENNQVDSSVLRSTGDPFPPFNVLKQFQLDSSVAPLDCLRDRLHAWCAQQGAAFEPTIGPDGFAVVPPTEDCPTCGVLMGGLEAWQTGAGVCRTCFRRGLTVADVFLPSVQASVPTRLVSIEDYARLSETDGYLAVGRNPHPVT
jgi:hypothetical protein